MANIEAAMNEARVIATQLFEAKALWYKDLTSSDIS